MILMYTHVWTLDCECCNACAWLIRPFRVFFPLHMGVGEECGTGKRRRCQHFEPIMLDMKGCFPFFDFQILLMQSSTVLLS